MLVQVRLEKLRSQATDKVMSKVASARRKAEEMRASAEAQQAEQLRKVSEKAANLRKTHHFPGGLTVCFARKM